jgi:[methyl-Co(III) methanol-specific corrinoid protein]:coenzyme M methyltransferase
MNDFTPRERLLNVLHREGADRPPAVCMGGMMNAALVEVMRQTGHTLPEAHFDPVRMSDLAQDVAVQTGFENIAVPFCMTVEAELLGSAIDHGTLACEPKIAKEAFRSVDEVVFSDTPEISGTSGRARTVAQSIAHLKAKGGQVPVIASLTGPVSTAASWVDPMTFIKELRKNKAGAHRVLQHVTDLIGAYARELAAHGADVIAIGDPTATGEILGPAHFRDFAAPYLNELVDRIHRLGLPVIVHICGDIKPVEKEIAGIRSDALSVDAMVNLKALKEAHPHLITMGNVSTYLLEFGNPDRIEATTRRLVHEGVDIISPACGLSTSTTLTNIRALTGAVKEGA